MLPGALRSRFGDKPLPLAITRPVDCGDGATYASALFGSRLCRPKFAVKLAVALPWGSRSVTGAPLVEPPGIAPDAVQRACGLLASEILDRLPLRGRARVVAHWLSDGEPALLANLTLGNVLGLRQVGAVTVLELATVLESFVSAACDAGLLTDPEAEPVRAPVRPAELDWLVTGSGEPAPWTHRVTGNDARFCFLPPGRSVADLLATPVEWWRLAASSDDLAKAVQLASGPVEEVAAIYLRAVAQRAGLTAPKSPTRWGPWQAALQARLGLAGAGPSTLQEAAHLAGVSRERVRQAVVTVRTVACTGQPWMPALEQAFALLAAAAPLAAEQVGPALAAAGLAQATMTLSGLHAIAAFTNQTPEPAPQLIEREGVVLSKADADQVLALEVVVKHTGTYGMTTPPEIARSLAELGVATETGMVERVLHASGERVRFTSDGWVYGYRSGPRNSSHSSLRNHAVNILSVLQPQQPERIHGGVERSFRFRGRDVVPSVTAMREFFAHDGEFQVHGDAVSLATPRDYHDTLGPVAASVVDILKASPYGAMDRISLSEAGQEAGVSAASIGVWTTYAEWLEHYAPNVWGLRGLDISPAVVKLLQERAQHRRDSELNRRRWTWAPDGTVVLAAYLTSSAQQSGVISFGTPLRAVLAGRRFVIRCSCAPGAHDRLGLLHSSTEHGWIWGWKRALRAHDVPVGAVVRMEVDREACTATFLVGGDELFPD